MTQPAPEPTHGYAPETPQARAQRHLDILREVQALTVLVIRHTADQILAAPPAEPEAEQAPARKEADLRPLFDRLLRTLHQSLAQEIRVARDLLGEEAVPSAEEIVARFKAQNPHAKPIDRQPFGPAAATNGSGHRLNGHRM